MNDKAAHRHMFRFTAFLKDGTTVERELLLKANASTGFFGWEEYGFFDDIPRENIAHITHLCLRQATEDDIVNESIRIAKLSIDSAFAEDKYEAENPDCNFVVFNATNRATNYRQYLGLDERYTNELAWKELEHILFEYAASK